MDGSLRLHEPRRRRRCSGCGCLVRLHDVHLQFSEDESFACFFDGGPYDASTCPSPQGIFSSDAGFPVGCVITENDNPSRIDGACVIPTFSCVATPTTHWEVSWTMY